MSKETLRIYFNPRCSKCRDALALAEQLGWHAELIRYLDTPPSREELRDVLHKLGMKPLELIRTGETVFKENFSGRTLSDEEWLNAMLTHPILIERPIVVRGDRAIVARPPEKLRELL